MAPDLLVPTYQDAMTPSMAVIAEAAPPGDSIATAWRLADGTRY